MADINDKRKKVGVRGVNLFRSRVEGDIPLSKLSEFYFVLRAIDGDKLAQELLDTAGTIIYDLDNNQIYPVQKKEK